MMYNSYTFRYFLSHAHTFQAASLLFLSSVFWSVFRQTYMYLYVIDEDFLYNYKVDVLQTEGSK